MRPVQWSDSAETTGTIVNVKPNMHGLVYLVKVGGAVHVSGLLLAALPFPLLSDYCFHGLSNTIGEARAMVRLCGNDRNHR